MGTADQGINPVRLAFHSLPLPVEVNVDLVYFPSTGYGDSWTIRFYRDDVNRLSEEDLERVIMWAARVRSRCQAEHENVNLEIWEGTGNDANGSNS